MKSFATTMAWARTAAVLAIAALSIANVYGQGTPGVVDILEKLPVQVPELPGATVRVDGNMVEALYNVPATPPNGAFLEIQIESYSSREEAELGVRKILHRTQIAPNQRESSGNTVVYKWSLSDAVNPKLEFHRTVTSVGSYSVDLSGPSEQLVARAFRSLVQQLGDR